MPLQNTLLLTSWSLYGLNLNGFKTFKDNQYLRLVSKTNDLACGVLPVERLDRSSRSIGKLKKVKTFHSTDPFFPDTRYFHDPTSTPLSLSKLSLNRVRVKIIINNKKETFSMCRKKYKFQHEFVLDLLEDFIRFYKCNFLNRS